MTETLPFSMTELDTLLEDFPIVPYGMDAETRQFLFMGKGVSELFGYKPEEILIISEFGNNFIHPEDLSQVNSDLLKLERKSEKTGGGIVRKYRFLNSQGHYISIRDYIKYTKSVDGKDYILGLWMKSELWQDQQDLDMEQSRLFLESILHNVPHMIFVKEARELRFQLFNKAGEKLLGVTNDALIGRNDYDFFPPEQAEFFQAKDRAVLQGKKLVDIPEEPLDTQNGRRWLHTLKVPITDELGEPLYLLGISEDITEKIEIKKQLELQHQKMVEQSRLSALGEMAGGIAHEINNPLAIINGYLFQLKRILLNDQNPTEISLSHQMKMKLEENISKMSETLSRITKIVSGLQIVSRNVEDSPFQLVEVSQFIENTLSLCREKFKNHGIELSVLIKPHNLTCYCRDIQISQVLVNLLNNAFYAANTQKEKWVRVSAEVNDEMIQISVIDSGPGITTEVEDKIFRPFFTTKPLGVGTGIGLSVSLGMMAANNGNLWYDKSSEHTRFVLELPNRRTGKER